MTLEATLFTTLGPLVSNRVYPDAAPDGVAALPRITYSRVGGEAHTFLEAALPNLENARVQVNVWAATRLQTTGLMQQVKAALVAQLALRTTVLSEMVGIFEPETRLYGAHQDFSFWTS